MYTRLVAGKNSLKVERENVMYVEGEGIKIID